MVNRAVSVAAICVLLVPVLVAQKPASLVGAWRMVERTRDGNTRRDTMQPNLWIFTDRHFALIQVNGDSPRPELPATATDQQNVEAWAHVVAEAGVYKMKGQDLWTTLIVSKDPAATKPGRFGR